jgi:HAD superfamily hydrolase (TIGR01549 family)
MNNKIYIDSLQAIFFDFDGVICESIDVKTEAFIEIYKPYGEEVVKKVVKHHIEHGGISRYIKIKYYHKEYLKKPINDEELEQVAQRFSDLVLEKVIASDLVKGTKEFLEKYYQKKDMYIISGTPEKELKLIVKKKNLGKYFKGVYGSPDTKPSHIDRIISENNYSREKVLYIGDSLSDYNNASQTKVAFLGISSGKTSFFPHHTNVIENFKKLL